MFKKELKRVVCTIDSYAYYGLRIFKGISYSVVKVKNDMYLIYDTDLDIKYGWLSNCLFLEEDVYHVKSGLEARVRLLENQIASLLTQKDVEQETDYTVVKTYQGEIISSKVEETVSLEAADLSKILVVEPLAKTERQAIRTALMIMGGNVAKTAPLLGITRTTLINKIKTYSIDVQEMRNTRRARKITWAV